MGQKQGEIERQEKQPHREQQQKQEGRHEKERQQESRFSLRKQAKYETNKMKKEFKATPTELGGE